MKLVFSLPRLSVFSIYISSSQVHAEAVSLARELLKMPPILPERTPRGEVIERDDRLKGAIQHKMIFTDITHHKEDNVRMGGCEGTAVLSM